MKNRTSFRFFSRSAGVKGVAAVGAVLALAVAIVGVLIFTVQATRKASAVVDATITGKVLSTSGVPITFECFAPGQPPSTCGIGVEANAGPETPPAWGGANTSDGIFSIGVTGGKKYKIEFRGPPEAIGQYTFPVIFVEINSGESKDIGTVVPTEKQGRISGVVKDKATLLPVQGAQVNAFPMFKPEDGGGEGPQGPFMPSMATSAADGTFTLKVDQGRFGIGLMQSPGSQYVYAGQPIEANCDTTTCNITGIEVLAIKADATITGIIVDTAGNPVFFPGGVGARPVGATDFFDYNGPIMPDNQNVPPGQPPTSGRYEIRVPSSTPQYTLTVHTPPGVNYSTTGDTTVTVVANGVVTKDLVVAADTSSIFGKVISDSGFALQSCKSGGDKFQGQGFGEVFAHNEKGGKFANAPIKEDCTFKMILGAGEYSFGYHLNPKAGYINRPAPPDPITVTANTDVEKNITVTAGDATITGQVYDATGKPLGNVWVDAGNEGEARKDFKSGGQEGPGGPGAGEFRGPGGTKDPEEMMKFCSDKKNEKECKNFKLPPGATGPGGCTNMLECSNYCKKNPKICQEFDKGDHDQPQGTSATILGQGVKLAKSATGNRAKANAEDVTKKDKGPDFNQNVIHMGTQAGPDGKFTLTVVSGHVYEVRANLPPDKDTGSAIPPKAVSVDLRTAKTGNVVLQFRTSFGTMTGKVTMPSGSTTDRCFVHYWSEAGDDGGSPCKSDGTYSLGYGQGKLHIAADSFDGRTPYRSAEQIITVTDQKKLTTNFQLKEGGFEVFSPASKTFDASEQATLTLDDGTEIMIPAGAMAESGDITVSASPTVNLKSTETAAPVGVGYTLTATNGSGQTITTFNSNVTVKIPYNENYVEKELGLDENLLKSVFKNDTTGAYEDNSNASQNTTEDSFTIITDHFTDYTIVSPGGVNLKSVSVATNGSKKAKITIDGSKTISLPDKKDNWSVGTANFGSTQYIVVSNKTDKVNKSYRGKIRLYGVDGKLKRTITPFKGFAGGLNQVVEDVKGKTGTAPDGTEDIVVAPATAGPAQALIVDLKNKKNQSVTTGTGTGVTVLNTAELVQAGIANLTTLYDGKTAKAWKMSKGKIIEAKGSIADSLAVKNGKVEKKTKTPKVSKVSGKCSKTSTSKLTITGSGFGVTSDPILLWNATSALAVQSFTDTQIKVTVNPAAIGVNTANTLTIVNSDGLAGVKVVTCGL